VIRQTNWWQLDGKKPSLYRNSDGCLLESQRMVSRVLKLTGSGRKADEPGPIDDCQESQAVGSFFEVVRPAEGEGEMIARDMKLNDDKSPLIDLISCIVCNETMKLEKSAPDSGGKDIIQYRCERCERIERVRLLRRSRDGGGLKAKRK
jgi:hypothetical protein